MNPFYAAWAKLDWLTEKRLGTVIQKFSSLENAWKYIKASDLVSIDPKTDISAWFLLKESINPEKELETLQKFKIQLLHSADIYYPRKLTQINSAPVFLYCKGSWQEHLNTALAVVGTRSPTHYGKQVTDFFVSHLGQKLTIVSGLAYGIDTIAHETCVKNKTPTVAVLGSGIDVVYPSENKELMDKIIEQGGCVLSEFPLGTPPNNYNFPRRNRIISGLSLGTLVIEGQQKSGSLITALYALEQNREIFALPGNIFSPQSEGTNLLIQRGEAKLVMHPNDVLAELSMEQESQFQEAQQVMPLLSNDELKIYQSLSCEGIDVSLLCESTKLSSTKITATLTLLELKGFVQNTGNGLWVKRG